MTKIQIRKGTTAEVVHLSHQIPEFINPYSEEVYSERLQDKPHLILIAESERQSVGFNLDIKGIQIFFIPGWVAFCQILEG